MESTMVLFEKTKDRPLYEQVREHLRQQCQSAQPDVALPTLRQMSEALGVNHITISRALRELEAEGILRVVPGKGTFVAKATNGNRSVEFLTLHVQSQDLLDTSQQTFKGMQDGLGGGFSLFGSTILMPPVPKADVFLQAAKARGVDALAIFGFGYLPYPDSFLETQFIHELAEQMPVVLVGKEHELLKLDCIYCDPAPQMRTFLEECYDKGLRKFEFVGARPNQHHLRNRLSGFQEFLMSRGLHWQSPGNCLSELDEISQILDRRPEVVVTSNPYCAHHFVVEAQQRGMQLSELQILCFAGAIDQVRAIAPYVSVVLLEEEEVGRCVINRLHNRLMGSDKPAPVSRRIPGKLVRQGKSVN